MRYNITIRKSSFGRGDGAIEIENNEFTFFIKSFMTRTLFGAVGVALASGKEALKFSVEDIQSYEVIEKTFNKELTIVLKDGNSVTFILKKDVSAEIMPILEEHVKQ